MHYFSKASLAALSTCHKDLQLIANETIKLCPVDFAVTEGHRSHADQLKYFLEGSSNLDPRVEANLRKAKHLKNPSEAFDFKVVVPGSPSLVYDPEHLTFIAGFMQAIAAMLKKEGKISHTIRWGGNWNDNGIILRDQQLWDRPHIELLVD